MTGNKLHKSITEESWTTLNENKFMKKFPPKKIEIDGLF